MQEFPEGRGFGRSIKFPDVLQFTTDISIDLDLSRGKIIA